MVRCLLASMPPGCVIPVHHDTGHWVKHSHRIHVAIVTDVAEVCVYMGVCACESGRARRRHGGWGSALRTPLRMPDNSGALFCSCLWRGWMDGEKAG